MRYGAHVCSLISFSHDYMSGCRRIDAETWIPLGASDRIIGAYWSLRFRAVHLYYIPRVCFWILGRFPSAAVEPVSHLVSIRGLGGESRLRNVFFHSTASSLVGNCQKSLHDRGTDDSLCVLMAVRHWNTMLDMSSHVGLLRLSLRTIICLIASAKLRRYPLALISFLSSCVSFSPNARASQHAPDFLQLFSLLPGLRPRALLFGSRYCWSSLLPTWFWDWTSLGVHLWLPYYRFCTVGLGKESDRSTTG